MNDSEFFKHIRNYNNKRRFEKSYKPVSINLISRMSKLEFKIISILYIEGPTRLKDFYPKIATDKFCVKRAVKSLSRKGFIHRTKTHIGKWRNIFKIVLSVNKPLYLILYILDVFNVRFNKRDIKKLNREIYNERINF